jgi:hypothetical protein
MIGVPFDGMGRAPGQAGAPAALRAAGLQAVFGPDVVVEPDLVLPGPVAQRAAGSGLLNERALLQMAGALHRRVRSSLLHTFYLASTALMLGWYLRYGLGKPTHPPPHEWVDRPKRRAPTDA